MAQNLDFVPTFPMIKIIVGIVYSQREAATTPRARGQLGSTKYAAGQTSPVSDQTKGGVGRVYKEHRGLVPRAKDSI